MATLVKTPSHTWKAVVRKQGWPTTAKTFRLKRDAITWARHVEDHIARSCFAPYAAPSRLLFDAAMDRYMQDVSPTKSPRTHASERGRAKHLRRFFGQYALASITPDVVAAYRDKRLASQKIMPDETRQRTAPLLAPPTVRLELALLSHLFVIAIREWRIGLLINPVSLIRRPSAGPGRHRRLLAGEEKALVVASNTYSNPTVGWIIRLALETAMRQGEILGLHLSDVNLHQRIVHLASTKNGSARTVPLSRAATQALAAAIAHPQRRDGCTRVFFAPQSRNGRLASCSFWFAWDDVRTKAGLVDFRFHDLRHEAISRLVEAGLSDQEVAAISGHRSMQMLRRYTHLRAEDLVARLDRLENNKRRRR